MDEICLLWMVALINLACGLGLIAAVGIYSEKIIAILDQNRDGKEGKL